MLDPNPIPVPRWLAKATTPVAEYLSLPTLPLHIHEILFAALFYHYTQTRISPWLSPKLFPKHYNKLSERSRLNWDVHVVSLVQSVLVCALSLYVMWKDDERREMNWQGRVWGYTGGTGLIEGFGCGYFVWDLWITATNLSMFGPGMLAHAVSALTVFSFGFRPFVNFYAPNFILYELSSPFLNIHWFCDKLDLTGSTIQLINGIFLLTTFFFCRLVWGTYSSFCVFNDVLKAYNYDYLHVTNTTISTPPAQTVASLEPTSGIMAYAGKHEAPVWLIASYAISNITLNCLNWYWMNKMIATIRKRFDPPLGTKRPEKTELKDVDVSRGVYADGHKSVELEATEIRKRPVAQRVLTGASDMMVA